MALCVAVKQVMRQMANAKDSAPFDFFVQDPAIVKVMESIQPKPLDLRAHRLKRRINKATFTRVAY